MPEERTPLEEAASWHGLATNKSLALSERLACALKALEIYEAVTAAVASLDRNDAQLRVPLGDSGVWVKPPPR